MNSFDIKKLRDKLDVSQEKLAEMVGVSLRTIQNYESGGVIPKSKYAILHKLAEERPEQSEEKTTQKTIGVPYYDIDISASITESFNDVREKPEFYVDFKYFNDCTAYLPIWGDSMYPAYASGEIIAVKRILNPEIIQWGEAHLVITNADANNMKTVKLLFPHDDQDKIILRASNPNFKGDTVIPKSSILSIYIVKGKITRKQL